MSRARDLSKLSSPSNFTVDANNNIGNYATLSPIDQVQGASVLSEGNLKITGNNN